MTDRHVTAIIAAIVLFAWADARGAEPNDPIPGYSGGYHEHAAEWPGNWIAEDFNRCCGKNDCVQVPDGGVTRNADGSYTVRETGETFAWADPELKLSQDGTYWRCRYQTDGHTRCLFVPPLGF